MESSIGIPVNNQQSGFAIGAILLVVVLIAAIAAAISLGSRGGSQNSTRERNKLMAATLISQGITLRNAIVMAEEDSGKPAELVARDGTVVTSSALCEAGAGNCVAIYDPTDGYAIPPTPPPESIGIELYPGQENRGVWIYREARFNGDAGGELGTAYEDSSLFLYTIPTDICSAINSILGVSDEGWVVDDIVGEFFDPNRPEDTWHVGLQINEVGNIPLTGCARWGGGVGWGGDSSGWS